VVVVVTVRPATPTHRGVVRTRELWFDRALLGDDEARRRVLARWRPGSTLRRLGPGWWLTLPAPARLDTRASEATALLTTGAATSSAPGVPRPGVWLFHGGEWVGGAADQLPVEDPSAWLDDALPATLATTVPLGDPPPVQIAAAPLALDLRSRLGFSAATTTALQQALAGLPAMPLPTGLTDGLRSLLAGFLGGAARAGNALAGSSPIARSWLTRLDAFAQALGLDAALHRAVGAHNARYLQDLLSRLEGGDWLEAVMRGIPLGGAAGGAAGLAWLSALQGLRWSGAGGGGGGGSVGAGPDFYERLRALYRKAFEALDAQGLVKEAAYVRGELLGEVLEAVDYLEQKREYRLAAELAESKQLDPGLVVTLWIRAGDEERAVALAIVREAFAVAVEQLERRGETERAEGLRLVWAHREFRAGRVVAAVDVAWKVEAARPLARGWLGAAVDAGGVGGARVLARSLVLRPEARASDLHALAALLEHDGVPARRALAEALSTDDDLSRKALRATARALLRDHRADPTPRTSDAARAAATRCGDGALAADLPPLAPGRTPAWPGGRVHHPVTAGDTGLVPTFDAAALPRDRWLVACGEAGAWIVDGEGRREATLAAPTHAIVTSRDGGRLLLLGRRGDRWRAHRLTLPDRRLERWVDLQADAVCAESDGSVWFVAQGDRVLALDALAPGLRSLWSVERLSRVGPLGGEGAPVLAMDHAPGVLRILVPAAGGEVERFQYALPTLALRERAAWPRPARATAWATGEVGFVAAGGGHLEAVGTATSRLQRDGVRGVATTERWVAATTPDAAELYQPDGLGFQPRAVVEATGATATWTRFTTTPDGEPRWVVGDDRGRVRVVDLADGGLRLDLRIG
jgi:hypothetical protein